METTSNIAMIMWSFVVSGMMSLAGQVRRAMAMHFNNIFCLGLEFKAWFPLAILPWMFTLT